MLLHCGAGVRQVKDCGSPDIEISATAQLFIFVQSDHIIFWLMPSENFT